MQHIHKVIKIHTHHAYTILTDCEDFSFIVLVPLFYLFIYLYLLNLHLTIIRFIFILKRRKIVPFKKQKKKKNFVHKTFKNDNLKTSYISSYSLINNSKCPKQRMKMFFYPKHIKAQNYDL